MKKSLFLFTLILCSSHLSAMKTNFRKGMKRSYDRHHALTYKEKVTKSFQSNKDLKKGSSVHQAITLFNFNDLDKTIIKVICYSLLFQVALGQVPQYSQSNNQENVTASMLEGIPHSLVLTHNPLFTEPIRTDKLLCYIPPQTKAANLHETEEISILEKNGEEVPLQHQAPKIYRPVLNNVTFADGSPQYAHLFKFIEAYCHQSDEYGSQGRVIIGFTNDLDNLTAGIDTKEKNEWDPEIISLIKGYKLPYLSIIFCDPQVLEFPFGVQKAIFGHELTHRLQYNNALHNSVTLFSQFYPKGPEQEADIFGMCSCNCYECAKEFASCCAKENEVYLTYNEAQKVLATMDPHQLCDYHKGIKAGKTHEVLMAQIAAGEINV